MTELVLEKEKSSGNLLQCLQEALLNYLNEKPSRSLNGLSKKCTVSEPTLRRIVKGQIKTLPTSTTILDILTTLTGEKNTALVAKNFPGPIADYLQSILPQAEECETEYDADLNNELRDSVKYIIYKLASNSSGLSQKKLNELFGRNGFTQAEVLLQKDYLYVKNNTYFSKVKHFTSNQDSFVANFKLIADYIKTQNPLTKTNLHSLLANYSESVSPEAYKEIVGLQKKTLQKIRSILADEHSKGGIPVFMLLAIDTLDPQPAHELIAEKHSTKEWTF
ncbi:hypothetical protein K2X05_04305 [bacterium]|nr:hypothetical protein [bacterium]